MKKTCLFLFALLSPVFLSAQQNSTKSQQEVQQAVIKLFDALSNRDSVALSKFCTSDVVFYEYGRVWTIDTLINLAITKNKAADFKRVNRFEFISTTIRGKTAWTTYNLHSEMTRGDKSRSAHWLETVILIKDDKKWKIKVLHSSLIK